MKSAPQTILRSMLLLAALLLLIFVFGRMLAGAVLHNTAYYWINRGTAVSDEHARDTAGKQAGTALSRAAQTNPQKSQDRELGFAADLQDQQAKALAHWATVDSMATQALIFGRRALESENLPAAQRWFEYAAELEPAAGDAWFYLGRVSVRQDDHDTAVAYYDRAVTAVNQNAFVPKSEVLCMVAWYYHWQSPQRNPERAERLYSQALAADEFETLYQKMDCTFKRGQLRHYALQNQSGAASDYATVLEYDPENQQVIERLQELQGEK